MEAAVTVFADKTAVTAMSRKGSYVKIGAQQQDSVNKKATVTTLGKTQRQERRYNV